MPKLTNIEINGYIVKRYIAEDRRNIICTTIYGKIPEGITHYPFMSYSIDRQPIDAIEIRFNCKSQLDEHGVEYNDSGFDPKPAGILDAINYLTALNQECNDRKDLSITGEIYFEVGTQPFHRYEINGDILQDLLFTYNRTIKNSGIEQRAALPSATSQAARPRSPSA